MPVLERQEEEEATAVISQVLCLIADGAAGPELCKLCCCVTGTMKRWSIFKIPRITVIIDILRLTTG